MYVMPTLRLADTDTASRYPLAVAGAAEWRRDESGWHLDQALPDLAAGTLLVPSLAFRSAPSTGRADAARAVGDRHRWTLSAGGSRWPLPPVPSPAPERPRAVAAARPSDAPVSTHIDCFRIHRRLPAPRLRLDVDAAQPPAAYLVAVSSRPFTVAAPPQPTRSAALANPPPPRSQMTAPAEIAPRICSPTCVSMVLNAWQRPHDWLTLTAECHDPASDMYGVWPLALRAAARRNSIGAVEVFADWAEPLAVLDRGVPLIASIRFARGTLPGAPLDETGGHLVVVHGAGPDRVDVCDPAAADGDVLRSYPADAFSQAWLRHRGAAYILPP